MKWDNMLLVALACLFAGCATGADQQVTQAAQPLPIISRLERQSFSAEELGIQMVGQPGSQTIRWKETISPKEPTIVPMLPIQGHSVQPRVAIKINGSPDLPFSIDSGAGLNLLDATLALRHGVKVADPKAFGNVFQGLGGTEYSYYGMLDRVTVGSLTIQNLFTVLRVHASGLPEDVDNVLGLTTLAKFSYVTLDFPGRQAVFALEGSYPQTGTLRAEVPLILHSLQLIVDLQINDRYAVNVLLDTGNDAALMLTEELVETLGLTAAAKAGRKSRFLGIGGTIETRTFPIDSISLGGQKFATVEATVVPNSFPPSLGSAFLQQFRATIDFKARKLWLEQ